MSLADASFNIFANRAQVGVEPNRSVSYYLKGCLVGLLLDLEIRRATRHRKSLDNVLRLLWERYGAKGVGFPEGAYRAAAEEVADQRLAVFWNRYVDGVEEIRWDAWFESVGLSLQRVYEDPDQRAGVASADPGRGWIGVEYERGPSPVRIRASFNPGPGSCALYPDDEIVAVNQVRVTTVADLEAEIRRHRPSDRVVLHVFRRGRLERVMVTLGQAPENRYRLAPRPDADETARLAYERWLAADWPKSTPAASPRLGSAEG